MTTSVILLAFLALSLLAALGLFVNLKLEVEKRSQKDRARVDAMLVRLVEAESRPAPSTVLTAEPELAVPRSGLNLSKRVQVMRLLRQGEDTGQIAAVLGLSRGEVQLLASVQTMVARSISKAAGE